MVVLLYFFAYCFPAASRQILTWFVSIFSMIQLDFSLQLVSSDSMSPVVLAALVSCSKKGNLASLFTLRYKGVCSSDFEHAGYHSISSLLDDVFWLYSSLFSCINNFLIVVNLISQQSFIFLDDSRAGPYQYSLVKMKFGVDFVLRIHYCVVFLSCYCYYFYFYFFSFFLFLFQHEMFLR